MTVAGRRIRWERFVDHETQRGLLVPIDHGLTSGPIDGLNTVREVSAWIGHPAINGIIAHKGMVTRLGSKGLLCGAGVMVHLNGMISITPHPYRKALLTTVEAAVRLGADGVSVEVSFDGDYDANALALLGSVVDEAQLYSVPVLAMVYDRVKNTDDAIRISRLRHLMRSTAELGVDAIKVAAKTPHEVGELLDGIAEDVPVFVAGGPLCADGELIELAAAAVGARATGLCVGRNVFQRPDAGKILDRLGAVLRQAANVDGGREQWARKSMPAR